MPKSQKNPNLQAFPLPRYANSLDLGLVTLPGVVMGSMEEGDDFVPNGTCGDLPNSLQHIAIIMDGNGRWAQSRGEPRVQGHRAGAKTVRRIVEESRRLGLRHLSLFTFSTENWKRPESEVSALMALFAKYLREELPLLTKHEIRLRVVGDRERLPLEVRNAIQETEHATLNFSKMDLILAVSYGGREDILHAVQSCCRDIQSGTITPEEVVGSYFQTKLWTNGIPDPDLLIRTSSESRISNFYLWQLAYSEIVITPKLWPDFDVDHFHGCIREYTQRQRRYGLTDEQIQAEASS